MRLLSLPEISAAVVAGPLCAAAFLIGIDHSIWGVFLALISPLPIYMATLGWSSISSGFAGVLAVCIAMVFSGPFLASVFSVIFVIPAFLLSHVSCIPVSDDPEDRKWPTASQLVQLLIGAGVFLVILVSLALAVTPNGLIGTVRDNLFSVIDLVFQSEGSDPETTGLNELVDIWDSLVLGLIVASVVIAHGAMGALGQGLVRSFATPRRTTPAFWQLRLPVHYPIAAVLLLAAVLLFDLGFESTGGFWTFAEFLATALLLVLAAGFLIQGLAVLHALTRGMMFQPLILIGCYFVVLIFQPFGALAFALIGFAEPWAGFRERFGVETE